MTCLTRVTRSAWRLLGVGRALKSYAVAFPSAAADQARQNPEAVVLDGSTLTPHAVALVARGRPAVRLASAARTRNDDARRAIGVLLARGDGALTA